MTPRDRTYSSVQLTSEGRTKEPDSTLTEADGRSYVRPYVCKGRDVRQTHPRAGANQ